MGYCTISDVNGLVPQLPFTAASIPSQAQVEQFIADISAEMDAVLRLAGYTTPVTSGPTALTLLRNACKWGVMGVAQDARTSGVVQDANVGGTRNAWTQRYVDWKKAVTDQRVAYDLVDAPRSGLELTKPIGSLESDTTSLSDDGGQDYLSNPVFRMGMKL